MVRFVSVATAIALTGLQVHSTEADNYGFRGGGRVDCKVSDWSPFEACNDAGFKTQTRYVVVEPSRGGSPCQSLVSTTRCSSRECWMGKWNDWACDSGSGMKQRTRVIATGGLQTEKKCPKKVERAGCDPIPCELKTLEEDVKNPWGECKLKRGVWTKSKALGVKWPAQYGGLCYEETHPVRKVSMTCPPVDCVVTPVEQDTGDWGLCTDSGSGVWNKTKTLSITPALYGGNGCSDASRVATASCAKDCKISTTEYDNWTACDATNNKYHPFKVLQQMEYGGLPCPPLEQRADQATCDVNCVTSAWVPGVCMQDSATGVWTKTSTRAITTNVQGNGTPCGDLTKTESCTINCESTESPIACQNDADGHWVKSAINVTTPMQYGGTSCPAPQSCDAEHFCDPLTDPTARAACVAALAKSEPLTEKTYWTMSSFYQQVPRLSDCIEKCAAMDGCTRYHFSDTKFCYFTFPVEYENNRAAWTGYVGGKIRSPRPVVCKYLNSKSYGALDDIPNSEQVVGNHGECCTLCQANAQCKGFTVAPRGGSQRCMLKTSTATVAVDYAAISGFVIARA